MENRIAHWPDNHRLAVLVTVMFEVWSEGKAPPYSPMTTALKPGTPDLLGISWSRYGGKTGIWRLMRILTERRVAATICLNARACELFPEAVRALRRDGHEIAAHSYTQDTILPYLEPEEERETIRKSTRLIEETVGLRPTGWFSPVAAPTLHTAAFLAREGYRWHGDYNDTDLPYTFETPHGKLVAIPHSDFTDNRTLRGHPRSFYQVYKDTFDFLYRSETPSLINLTVHAHFGGRPLMAAMLDELLRYFKEFPGVWFARHDQLAEWVLENTSDQIV